MENEGIISIDQQDQEPAALDQTSQLANQPRAVNDLAVVLIILTFAFLLLSIIMTGIQLYSVYGVLKSEKDLQRQVQQVEEKNK